MDASVTSSPDLSIEIPVDSSKTPSWFEDALTTPRKEGWLILQVARYITLAGEILPILVFYSSMGFSHTRDALPLLRRF